MVVEAVNNANIAGVRLKALDALKKTADEHQAIRPAFPLCKSKKVDDLASELAVVQTRLAEESIVTPSAITAAEAAYADTEGVRVEARDAPKKATDYVVRSASVWSAAFFGVSRASNRTPAKSAFAASAAVTAEAAAIRSSTGSF